MKSWHWCEMFVAGGILVSAPGSLRSATLDFGDAPDTGVGTGVGNYQTTMADNGACHTRIGPFFDDAVMSGAGFPDAETDGQPTANADGDDNDGNDDEQGVLLPPSLTPGGLAIMTVYVNAGPPPQMAFVDVWIDFNKDGDWTDASEKIFAGQLPTGIHPLNFTVPATALPGLTFSRFRINSHSQLLLPTGMVESGEVEDHPVWIEETGQWPWKWLQEPDTTPLGFDTECMTNRPILLADDFLCYQPSTITNIVIWGSWTNDVLPTHQGVVDPRNVSFTVSIHEDIPAGQQAPWSMPGKVLWWTNFPAWSFKATAEFEQLDEGWYYPATSNYSPHADTVCWRYEFAVPLAQAFVQTGTVVNPIVYWLDVQADPLQDPRGGSRFGWKTTSAVDPDNRWNDDACWAPAIEPYNGFWWDMHYPPSHPYFQLENNSFDLAFMLMGGPVPEPEKEYDWGDAPDKPYPTLAASGGANHLIVAGAPWLGDVTDGPDADGNGQPDPNALGDDNDGNDDEDGVRIPALAIGGTQAIQFQVGGASGVVEGWIDFNGDGIWSPGAWPAIGEEVVNGTFAPGIYQLPVTVAGATVVSGVTFARFRISTAGTGGSPVGAAADGEVEDHRVRIFEDVPPDPQAKWWQPPDLTELGVDVRATNPNLLADDFACTGRSAVTRIVVWGSWRDNKYPPEGSPGSVPFVLSFHADIPVGDGVPYSRPADPPLWCRVFQPGQFLVEPVTLLDEAEWWQNPDTNNPVSYFPGDNNCWKFTFHVPYEEAFVQTGTVDNAVVYWLDLQLTNSPGQMGGAEFGWKSSYRHWNDDAVWALGDEASHTPWEELRYAPPHQLEGMSMDMAFALYGELRDCGDAPAPYPTLLAAGGASHMLAPGPWLGSATDAPDADPDGQPDANAVGDDNNGAMPDDENGVIFPVLVVNQTTNISVEVSSSTAGAPALVDAWIDWNADGDWSDANEQIMSSVALPVGVNQVSLPVPPSASNGWTFARFRISTAGSLNETGSAADGEVEDYRVYIEQADWGDAPGNPTGGPRYPTTAADSGACHIVVPGIMLGSAIDAEPDGQPTAAADGDDLNDLDDEDGVVFTSLLIAGQSASCQVTASVAGYLVAWLDGNTDYDWDDAGEQTIAVSLSPGTNYIAFAVPNVGVTVTYMRFRFSTQPIVGVRGLMPDGEVEDYQVTIDPYQPEEIRDFGDAPDPTYPTLAANGGAAHLLDRRYILGALWDSELDGLPTSDAAGDDMNGLDDEDGVTFVTPLIRGSNATVRVQASTGGFVSAWFDFDQDGTWSGAGEQALAGVAVAGGVNDLTAAVPAGAALGPTYARFRYTSIPGAIGVGRLLVNGEVEDYAVQVLQSVVPGSIVITNFMATQMVARVWWRASNDTLTAVQICTNLVTNATAWVDVTLPSLARYYNDSQAVATSRFYRVYAPYVAP